MAGLKDPSDSRGERLYMAGDVPASRVDAKSNGITGLFRRFEEFDRLVAADIAKMPDGADKTNAKASLDGSNNVLKAANDLRIATRNQKLHDELMKKFSPTGKLDKIYEYEKDGKTLRFDPVHAKKNPQMNDPILEKRIKDHINLFISDGSNGKGAGLINYDPRYLGTNQRHQRIITIQQTVGKAYGKNCK
ncbi:hypothetical protein V8F33_012910 [Rhypophila sp. PSN 637]